MKIRIHKQGPEDQYLTRGPWRWSVRHRSRYNWGAASTWEQAFSDASQFAGLIMAQEASS